MQYAQQSGLRRKLASPLHLFLLFIKPRLPDRQEEAESMMAGKIGIKLTMHTMKSVARWLSAVNTTWCSDWTGVNQVNFKFL